MKSYRAKIVAVSPKHRQPALQPGNEGRSAGCQLGYSLGNPQFSPDKMRGVVEWVDQRFERCAILIGDNIYRITLQIDRGLSDADALREALRLGRERAEEVRAILGEGRRCRFTLAPCSEMARHPGFAALHRELEALYDNDASYARSVREFSAAFLRRRERVTEEHLALSRQYLSEELAIMACAHRDGHQTFVYPGNLAIAAELADGLHPTAPRELRELTTVALDLLPRASSLADCPIAS